MSDGIKKCKHCGVDKATSDFNTAGKGRWLQPYCKPCDKIRKDKHRADNFAHYKEKGRVQYLKTRVLVSSEQKQKSRESSNDKLVQAARRYAEENRLTPEEKKRRKSECDRRYRDNNKLRIIANKRTYKESGRATETAKAWQARMMSDVGFRLKKNLRGRIYVALKRGVKSAHTMDLLGCTITEFKMYFESLFTEGMNWDTYMNGGIHIDHIIPCVNFSLTDPEEQKKCFHYKNLQPLWAIDNLRKGITYNEQKAA